MSPKKEYFWDKKWNKILAILKLHEKDTYFEEKIKDAGHLSPFPFSRHCVWQIEYTLIPQISVAMENGYKREFCYFSYLGVAIIFNFPLFFCKGQDEECLYAKTWERRRVVRAGDTGIYAVASELEGRKPKASRTFPILPR